MSAESPQHRRGSKPAGHVIRPQPVSDKSFIESVAGFINEVVPQAYTGLPQSDTKDSITWARFEQTDANDPALCPDPSSDTNDPAPPLLLTLGYTSGVQVWAIHSTGEAQEVLSWRQGVVRTLRLLPSPEPIFGNPDTFASRRPLVALCDSGAGSPQFCSLSFVSLRTGDQVKSIKFKKGISDIVVSRRVVAATFPEKIAVFDACTLEDRFTVSTCFPSPGPNPNPVCLGSRWLAYADKRLVPAHQSGGGVGGESSQSYTATMIHAAKTFTRGLKELGETVASSLTGQHARQQCGQTQQPGTVTILDVRRAGRGDVSVDDSEGVIAHFVAHYAPVTAIAFDPSGNLVLTADRQGHDFHVFRINPHPLGPASASAHHLYTLHRGDTTAKVQDISFSLDSRWVAVSTLRGTTHLFPITPYGGAVGVRTHTTHRVVNRLSRFHRSAGLDDAPSSGRNSPIAVPDTPTTVIPYPNPRLPPYPYPTHLAPLAQLRQPLLLTLPQPRSPLVGKQRTTDTDTVQMRVVSTFAFPRAWVVGSPTGSTREKTQRKPVDALFVMACHGSLVEYTLDPHVSPNVQKDKICDDSPIELEVKAKAQWNLLRPPMTPELQPPLLSGNPLLITQPSPVVAVVESPDSRETDSDERWLSQVEIVTHAGPHRRLWMGPQFSFKTYHPTASDPDGTEVTPGGNRLNRSNPVNMPVTTCGSVVPVLIEAGSGSSFEQSPQLVEVFGDHSGYYSYGSSGGMYGGGRGSVGGEGKEVVDTQLRENLAEAMMESCGMINARDAAITARLKRDLQRLSDQESDIDPPSSPPPSFRVSVATVRKTAPQCCEVKPRVGREMGDGEDEEGEIRNVPCTKREREERKAEERRREKVVREEREEEEKVEEEEKEAEKEMAKEEVKEQLKSPEEPPQQQQQRKGRKGKKKK